MLRPEKNRETRRAAYGTVHCKGLRKSYSYEENGCCPSCGAYNRPPRRETVEADGTVHHLDDRAAPTGRMPGGGGKVCFEEKTCYEEQARGGECGARPKSHGGKPAGQPLFAKLVTAVIIAIAVGMIVSVLRMIIASSVWDMRRARRTTRGARTGTAATGTIRIGATGTRGTLAPTRTGGLSGPAMPMTRAGPPRRTGRIFSTAALGLGEYLTDISGRVDAYTRSGDAM